jgi:hypothetical protein
MEKTTELNKIDVIAERERLLGIFRKMVAEKKEDRRTAPERFKNDPELQKAVNELRKQNAERGTPFIRL